MKLNLQKIGERHIGESFIIDGIDINTCYVVDYYIDVFWLFFKKLSIKGISIKAASAITGWIFFGEKKVKNVIEIYLLDEESNNILLYNFNSHLYKIGQKDYFKFHFSFLLNEYDFSYEMNNLGDAIDKNGKFFFYGPVKCYSFYNDNICVNILHLVQRDDFEIFITNFYKKDQVYIRNGFECPSKYAYNIPLFVAEIKKEIIKGNTILGFRIK